MTLERCQCDGRGEAAQMTHAAPYPSQRNPGRYSVYNESLRRSHCLACRHENNEFARVTDSSPHNRGAGYMQQ